MSSVSNVSNEECKSRILQLENQISNLIEENKKTNRLLYTLALHDLNYDRSKLVDIIKDIEFNKNDINKIIKYFDLVVDFAKKYPNIVVDMKPAQNIIECSGDCITSLKLLKTYLINCDWCEDCGWVEFVDNIEYEGQKEYEYTLNITIKKDIL